MIVKNGGEDLRLCLRSAAPVVQQMVVADTGSTDSTREILREFGATVVDFPWTNHYGEARNASLEALTTDWVLVLDADEELDRAAAARIPGLLASGAIPEQVGAIRMWQRHYFTKRYVHAEGGMSRPLREPVRRAEGALSYADIGAFRLFRNLAEFRYTARIHEVIDGEVAKAGFELANAGDLVIHHFGKLVSHEDEVKKNLRYGEMLRLALAETPEDARLWVQLAHTERSYLNNEDEAIRCYERALALSDRAHDAEVELAHIYTRRGEYERTLAVLDGMKAGDDLQVLQFELRGDVMHALGRLREAREMYRAAVAKARERGADGTAGVGLKSKLGYVEVAMGMEKTGLRRLREAIEADPTVLDFHDRLVKSLVLLKRDREAADAAEEICRHYVNEQIIARAAALRMRVGDYERVRKVLALGLRLFPGSERLKGLAAVVG